MPILNWMSESGSRSHKVHEWSFSGPWSILVGLHSDLGCLGYETWQFQPQFKGHPGSTRGHDKGHVKVKKPELMYLFKVLATAGYRRGQRYLTRRFLIRCRNQGQHHLKFTDWPSNDLDLNFSQLAFKLGLYRLRTHNCSVVKKHDNFNHNLKIRFQYHLGPIKGHHLTSRWPWQKLWSDCIISLVMFLIVPLYDLHVDYVGWHFKT